MKRKVFFYSLIVGIFVFVFVLCDRLSETIRLAYLSGANIIEATNGFWGQLADNPLYLSLSKEDLLTAASITFMLLMWLTASLGKKWRTGEEYGSARWGTKRDIAPFVDPVPDRNVILTATEKLTINSRPKNPLAGRNKNVLVTGGSGSGKTRFWVKPNLMQLHSSYVVTDPKGTLLAECGKLLADNGYTIRVLNLNGAEGMRQSQRYNPFAYIHCDADILQLVDVLMSNTSGEGKNSGEKFWTDAERLMYCALIGYIFEVGEPEECNILTLLLLIESSATREENDDYHNPVDILMAELEEEKPDCFAVRQYKKFKLAPGKTAQSILISCGARLAPFDISELHELMEYDELELDTLGDRKTAMFVITSDTNKTFNFVAAIMYSQLFNLLCDKALYVYGGRLPVHVRFLLDEFANIGKIPNFDEIISVIRSREISACIILQSKSQLEKIYDKAADIIIDNCDSYLFLGGKSTKAIEEVSKLLGKETINNRTESSSRGTQKSDGNNTQQLGRELMTVDELASMPQDNCICIITGLRPFKSKKYNLLKHPRYRFLADADPKNIYIPPWIALSEPPQPDEEFYCMTEEVDEFPQFSEEQLAQLWTESEKKTTMCKQERN